MEIMNALLSDNVGYLNALRNAQPMPQLMPVIAPQVVSHISSKKIKVDWGIWIVGLGVAYLVGWWICRSNYPEKTMNYKSQDDD